MNNIQLYIVINTVIYRHTFNNYILKACILLITIYIKVMVPIACSDARLTPALKYFSLASAQGVLSPAVRAPSSFSPSSGRLLLFKMYSN